DDEGNAGNAKQQPRHLAPGQRLAEEHRRGNRGEYRIGADDQAAEPRGDGLEAGVTEAEKERVVGDAEHGKHHGITPGELPSLATNGRMPRIRMPASKHRAVSRISGGQSVTPILPATKAKLQSRQNRMIYIGNGLKPGRGTATEGASDMGPLLVSMI